MIRQITSTKGAALVELVLIAIPTIVGLLIGMATLARIGLDGANLLIHADARVKQEWVQ